MGLFDKIFPKKEPEKLVGDYFKTLTAYQPAFTTFEGSLYEMDLTRAAVHSFATHISKLKPEVKGSGNKLLERKLQYRPNPYQDTSKFLYRLATIYQVRNNAFIAPLYDKDGKTVSGYFPLLPQNVEFRESGGRLYVVYDFGTNKAAIEFEKTGLLNQFQYRDDFFGEDNRALNPTLDLLDTQNQGIVEGIKSSAYIRFMARLAGVLKDKDIKAEQKRFAEDNLSKDNTTGVMMFDQKYADVKQVISKPFVVDAAQMNNIKESVFNYFGTNEDILQNKFTSDKWNAYYEGKIEAFAIQLSLVMTNMTFSDKEIAFGNEIMFTTNRLQYASNQEKLQIVTQLFDRGFLTHNQGLEIYNMPPVDDGDKRYIRKEYAEYNKVDEVGIEEVEETEEVENGE